MAKRGVGFFDGKGHFFKTPDEATMSDLAAILGRVGDGGESLALGIAKMLLDHRTDVERIFSDHDDMVRTIAISESGKVLPLRSTGSTRA